MILTGRVAPGPGPVSGPLPVPRRGRTASVVRARGSPEGNISLISHEQLTRTLICLLLLTILSLTCICLCNGPGVAHGLGPHRNCCDHLRAGPCTCQGWGCAPSSWCWSQHGSSCRPSLSRFLSRQTLFKEDRDWPVSAMASLAAEASSTFS